MTKLTKRFEFKKKSIFVWESNNNQIINPSVESSQLC